MARSIPDSAPKGQWKTPGWKPIGCRAGAKGDSPIFAGFAAKIGTVPVNDRLPFPGGFR